MTCRIVCLTFYFKCFEHILRHWWVQRLRTAAVGGSETHLRAPPTSRARDQRTPAGHRPSASQETLQDSLHQGSVKPYPGRPCHPRATTGSGKNSDIRSAQTPRGLRTHRHPYRSSHPAIQAGGLLHPLQDSEGDRPDPWTLR